MPVRGARETIHAAVTRWPGVSSEPHRFGGTEYRIRRRELGHIHGDYLVDIPFPTKVRNELVDAGRASPHHVLPDSGWASFYINDPSDVDAAIELLRLSFDIATARSSLTSD